MKTSGGDSAAEQLHALEADNEVVEVWHRLRDATLGEYDIYAPLGRGGMATVFLALDLALEREVAIKVLSTSMIQSRSLVERFKREARTSAALSHPNIIPVFAVKEVDGLAFFVMKYVDGRSLDSIICDEGPLSFDITVNLLRQIGDALHFAHRKGVIHRDVKPANVMIDHDGWAIVTDFGIAKVADASALTSAGLVVGTPAYMSPEQFSGGDITGAADQYSLGVVAYEMLTGHVPFGAATVAEMMRSHMMDDPAPLQRSRPDIPPAFADAVLRMLSKEPASRWPSIGEGVSTLELLSKERQEQARSAISVMARSGSVERPRISVPISPSPSRAGPTLRAGQRPAGRRRRLFTVGAGVTLLGVAILSATYMSRKPAASSRPPLAPADSAVRPSRDSLVSPDRAARGTAPAPPRSQALESPKRLASQEQAAGDKRTATARESGGTSKAIANAAKDSSPSTPGAAHQEGATALASPPPAAPPLPVATEGFVVLGSRIPTSVLYVDGTARGFINSMRVVKLPARGVRIGVHAEGCEPWDSTITVTAGDTLRLNYRNPTCPP